MSQNKQVSHSCCSSPHQNNTQCSSPEHHHCLSSGTTNYLEDLVTNGTCQTIITIANQQNTLILLTCSALSGFSLYKYTIETHIKQLMLRSNIMHKMTDWNTHKSGSIKLLTILVFLRFFLQKKWLHIFIFCHNTTTKTEILNCKLLLNNSTYGFLASPGCTLQTWNPNHIISIS